MTAAVRVVPADVLTPIGAYLALAQPQASCLLESVESGGRISRYSFIGLDYRAAATFDSAPELFDRVRSFVAEHRAESEDASLGGALLAFAYDAARCDARLGRREPSRPAMPAAYVAIPATWLIFDHFSDRLTLWCSGDNPGSCERRIGGYLERLLAARPAMPRPLRALGAMSASLERDRFLTLVGEVKRHIFEGDVYQLQLGIRFGADLDGSAFDLYRALRRENPSPYMFYVDTPFGQMLGASPEFLVRLEGRKARIRPLAGTRWRGRDDEEDARLATELLANEKERAEHVMLVDLGRNDLGSVCEYGSVQVDELLQIERYSHVMHIVSNVVGRLREDRDALDLFRAGFPAGTVTGTPKIRAMQLIDELEPVTRGFYAGSIGRWSFGGDFDSCITLRSVHVQEGRAWWQASAGIVADSDPAAEYREVFDKTRIAREVLGVS
ncbi:MAG: chorismate-binding protein [Candidatus Eremiobacteraeota bacterium]|nr:chorismate-binding protein [Candidatus Eremiobacteraeota bacterium]MBV8500019.1 chorismate-binding protein [Candidatus Eremiobacteraeota bacterium]